VDDNFIGNKAYLKSDLLPALIKWQKGRKGIPFNTEASINLADDRDLMDMMVEAGFDTVFIGIETPDDNCLMECNKVQNKNRNILENIRLIQRAGLQVQGGFIVGFDNDTPSIFKKQIEFIQKSGIVTAMVGILNAPPGTRLYERMSNEGRLIGLISGDNVDGTTNFIPMMGLDELREGYRRMIRHIYSPKHYYKRAMTLMRECKIPKKRVPMDFQRFLAVLRSSIRLGLLGRERLQYWKILSWTFFHRPRLVPMAITIAIYGHHFRKVARKHCI